MRRLHAANESYEERQMLWEGMTGRGWAELVQQWGVPVVEPLQLQKSIAALMREVGPRLGDHDLHWGESTGLGRESKVLPEEAVGAGGSSNAQETEGGRLVWREGSRGWQAKKMLEWAAKELAMSRRDIELMFGDIQDWRQREEAERRMGDSLLK